MCWVDTWVGLGWVGSGWRISVSSWFGWVMGWVMGLKWKICEKQLDVVYITTCNFALGSVVKICSLAHQLHLRCMGVELGMG